ncbi:diflavin flavoprotein [Gloeobacter kilaueensis]|uniref:Flavoprotein n=1 Tax=Gloeobacter kilaueensis (strain ATCC BAA-2537 / CCAP 1431/1 / ULC 316 / JS1) TaxID=1183438 RepID=U5QJ24_GLOK1|nr:diflavin flavoprotein [Gloeobacter kilaueensis]AGY57629.1 flavoprotein [Gloeobacter kilaueensis JS1]
MTTTPAAPVRDIQTIAIAPETWFLRSRSFVRLKFEVEYARQHGTTSNAFLLRGEKTVLLTPPGETFTALFLAELERLIPLGDIDYIVLGHINPNRFKTLVALVERIPNVAVVCSNPGAIALRSLIESEAPGLTVQIQVVRGQEALDLGGGRLLQFIPTPTPRWPEGLCVFDERTAMLFTDKFFGAHVADTPVFDDSGSRYSEDSRYYYDCLMANQVRQVEAVLDRLAEWPARAIAPVHGPLLRSGGLDLIAYYREWNRGQIEQTLSVALLFASAYGSTATLAQALAHGITKAGVAVETINCEHATPEEIREVVSRTDGFLIGSPTLGGHAPTPIQTALGIVLATAPKAQLAGVFGSFGWSGEAIDLLENKLRNAGYSFGFEPIRVKFKPTAATLQECEEAGIDFAQALKKTRKARQGRVPAAATPVEQAVGRIVGSLCVVTAREEDTSSAMLASWVSQATFNPPGLTVAVAKDRAIESLMYPGQNFVLNILAEERYLGLMKHFLKPFGPGEDRFVGVSTRVAANGSPILTDALAYIECQVAERMECGDHWLVYCVAEGGDVLDANGRTAVHFRTTGTRY